ncbi:MAG: peroxiredoxin [Gloeomargarita sp. GMQP_bins_120]
MSRRCAMTQATVELKPIPRIGDPAPDFEVMTTHGVKRLSDYRGHWVILFSHPADFTPVCTTEMVGLAKLNEEFEKRNAKLLGLSVDSIHSHIAWLENIRQNFGIELPFPIIADIDMKVSSLYGMIHPGASSTATVRAVFFIDPDGIIQALVYYPLTNGRNLDELLRLLDSLQTSREYKVATPANWHKGERVIEPPPKTVEELRQRREGNYPEKVDFYLVKKDL